MVSAASAHTDAAPAGQRTKGSSTIKSMVSGGIAGAVAKTFVAPIERVKILFQVSTRQHLHIGISDTLVNIAKNEGIRAYWKGNWANCSRVIPYAAVQYVAHEHAKKLIYPDGHESGSVPVHPLSRVCAGSIAGVVSVCATYPLDLIRSRLVCQIGREGTGKYAGIIDCCKQIYQQEGGVRALYKGGWPTVIGVVPYAGINFCMHEVPPPFPPLIACLSIMHLLQVFKSYAKEIPMLCQRPTTQDPRDPKSAVKPGDLRIPTRLACGALAGAIGQTFVYPLDTVRLRCIALL